MLYLGDYDLSGGQIEDNTRRVLEREVGSLTWERVALSEQQVADYELPVITKKDRRYKDGRPHEAVETEAISQRVLIEIQRARLAHLLPEPLQRVQEREMKRLTRPILTAYDWRVVPASLTYVVRRERRIRHLLALLRTCFSASGAIPDAVPPRQITIFNAQN